uniref:Uncharacterized protein n=1 Tax=Magallana gigas TaxID=29159 RepID=A0A8W8JJF3_MAGGI
MIGNENRMTATGEDDETPVDDVISNKRLTVGKCKMWCGHWTAPNSLFDWTKEKLPGALTEGLPCPKCIFYHLPVQFGTTSLEACSGRGCPCEIELNLAKTERQNSELDANLKLLSQQSEAAAAAAEVDALE